jgi:hypothetical protein
MVTIVIDAQLVHGGGVLKIEVIDCNIPSTSLPASVITSPILCGKIKIICY